MNKIFTVNHINYAYHTMQGEIPALSDITFDVEPKEFLAIVGPSGCGKSTLLNLLSGMLHPESGSIELNRQPLNPENRLQIGYMLQQDYLLEWRSILKNILLGLEIRGNLNAESIASAKALLEQYGLEKFASARPSQLSGGMRQRAALVRTLVLKPELLLLDEPFSALDYQTRLTVGNDIGNIIRKQRKTAVLVTHDLSEAVSMADRIIILSSRPGKIHSIVTIRMPEELSPMQRRNHPAFKEYFNDIWNQLQEAETNYRLKKDKTHRTYSVTTEVSGNITETTHKKIERSNEIVENLPASISNASASTIGDMTVANQPSQINASNASASTGGASS